MKFKSLRLSVFSIIILFGVIFFSSVALASTTYKESTGGQTGPATSTSLDMGTGGGNVVRASLSYSVNRYMGYNSSPCQNANGDPTGPNCPGSPGYDPVLDHSNYNPAFVTESTQWQLCFQQSYTVGGNCFNDGISFVSNNGNNSINTGILYPLNSNNKIVNFSMSYTCHYDDPYTHYAFDCTNYGGIQGYSAEAWGMDPDQIIINPPVGNASVGFHVVDGCSASDIPYASVTFAGATQGTSTDGWTTFFVPPNTNSNWSVSGTGYNSANGNSSAGGSGSTTNIPVTLTRTCGGGTPPPDQTPPPPPAPPAQCTAQDNANVVFLTPPPSSISPGQVVSFTVKATNTGNTSWYKYYDNSGYTLSQISGYTIGLTQPSQYAGQNYGHLPWGIDPGGDSYTWSFNMTAPSTPGNYSLKMVMTHDGVVNPDPNVALWGYRASGVDFSPCGIPQSAFSFGNTATANFTVTTPPPSGSLSPLSSSCTIAAGASTCTKDLTWDLNNPVGSSAITSSTATPSNFSLSSNSGTHTFTIPRNPAGTYIFLYNNSVELAQVVVVGDCVSGSTWDATSGTCKGDLTVTGATAANGTISPASQTVHYGATTTLTITPNSGYGASASGCGGSLSGTTYTTGAVTANCTVTPVFSLQTYTVNATAGSNGTISPASRTVNAGSTTTFTVTPNSGYSIFSIAGTCPAGALVGTTYTTGAITGDCTVSASFTINTYTVNATAGSNGTISPASRTVNHGSTTTFTVTPNTNYVASMGGTCPAGSLVGTTYTTGAITAGCTVTASFANTPSMSGTLSPSTNSCIISAGSSSCTINFTWTTTNPVATSSVTSDTNSSGASAPNTVVASGNSGGPTAFTIPYPGRNFYLYNNNQLLASAASGSIIASCAGGSTWDATSGTCKGDLTVTGATAANGTISPASQTVHYGATTTLTITPNSGYGASASGCGGSLSGTTYTTGAVTANCTVTPVFSVPTYTVTAVAGAGGTITPSSQTANYNTTKTLTVTPNAGHGLLSVAGCGGSISGSTYTTGAITSNCTVTASFVSIMSGSLTGPSSCTIAAGAGTCAASLSWGINSPEASPTAITANGMLDINVTNTLSTPQSGTQSVSVPNGGRTFFLYNNAKSLVPTSPNGTGVFVNATCISGTSWNVGSGTCVSASDIPPVANAGPDQSITLPTTSVTMAGSATDSDGTIASKAWTFISGPATPTITTPSSYTTTITGLSTTGTYVFRLTATDNIGAAGTDDVNIVVSAAGSMSGTLSGPASCTIASGSGTCSVTLTWSVTNHESTASAITANGMTDINFSNVYSGTQSVSVPNGGRTFFLYNNAKSLVPTSPNGSGVNVTASCISGTSFDVGAGICVSASDIAPTVNAGIDQMITLPTSSVTMAGSATDSDGTIASKTWSFVSGPATPTITTPSSYTTTVTGLSTAGTYIFRLTATDNQGATGTDDVNIVVSAAGVMSGSLSGPASCTIASGSSTCSVTLSWGITNPEGTPTAITASSMTDINVTNTLSTPQSGTQSVSVPNGGRTFFLYNNAKSLVPTSPNGTGVFVNATCISGTSWNAGTSKCVIVNNLPTANAGIDQTIAQPTSTVTMSGSATDSDGTIASKAWSFVSGPATPTITTPSSYTTTITGLSAVGTYTFRLTVTDNQGGVGTDNMLVVVNAATGFTMSGDMYPSYSYCSGNPPFQNPVCLQNGAWVDTYSPLAPQAYTCSIPAGASTCNVKIDWRVNNVEGTPTAITANGMTDINVSNSLTPTFLQSGTVDVPMPNGSRTIFLYNNAKSLMPTSPNGTGLALSGSCVSGTTWDTVTGKCLTNGTTAPAVAGVSISSATVIADGNTTYDITVTTTDSGGFAKVRNVDAIINYQMPTNDTTDDRGELRWNTTNSEPNNKNNRQCNDGSYGGVWTNGGANQYGTQYINLSSCTVTNTNSTTRVIKFTVTFNNTFTAPVYNNFIYGFASNSDSNATGWVNLGTNFSLAVMSGTLTGPSSCTIALGASNCSVNLDWSLTSPEATPTVIRADEMTDISVTNTLVTPQSGTQSVVVPNGGRTFFLYNNNKSIAPTSPNGVGVLVDATCTSGTAWDTATGKCLLPTGTISATSCTIAQNASTCNSTLNWSVNDPIPQAATEVTHNNPDNTHVSYLLSGTNKTSTIRHGSAAGATDTTFYLYHNSNILGSAAVTATCISGTVWDGLKCTGSGGVPVVGLESPASGSYVSGVIQIKGYVVANANTSIKSVEFLTASTPVLQASSDSASSRYLGGFYPNSRTDLSQFSATPSSPKNIGFLYPNFNTTTLSDGPHTITIQAEDNDGNTVSADVPINVNNNNTNDMTGTLTPAVSSCIILSGQSSCNINFSWVVTNPLIVGGSAVTKDPNVAVATGDVGNNVPLAVKYSSETFYLYNNATLLAQQSVTSSCTSGTTWDYVNDKCIDIVQGPAAPTGWIKCNGLTGNSCTIPSGGSANITWLSTNTDSCTINPGNLSGTQNSTGVSTGPLTQNTTYDMSCHGLDGSTYNSSVTVNVQAFGWIKCNGSSISCSIPSGSSATITWKSFNTDSCLVTPGGSTLLENLTGISTGPLTQNTIYNLSCHGIDGSTYESLVSININLPNRRFNEDPQEIINGDLAVVAWSCPVGNTCTSNNFDTGGASSGAIFVDPDVTTDYTYTVCAGSSCTTYTKTITVKRKRPIFIEP